MVLKYEQFIFSCQESSALRFTMALTFLCYCEILALIWGGPRLVNTLSAWVTLGMENVVRRGGA